MKQQLVISALGGNQPDLMEKITATVKDCGAGIVACRMDILGNEATITMLVSGSWDAIAKLEDVFGKLEYELGLKMMAKRTTRRLPEQQMIPYTIEIVCSNHDNIASKVTRFLTANEINICELYINTFQNSHSDLMLLSIHMTVNVPADSSISVLRSEFMDFCDRLNLDGIMEPVKNI